MMTDREIIEEFRTRLKSRPYCVLRYNSFFERCLVRYARWIERAKHNPEHERIGAEIARKEHLRNEFHFIGL